MNEPTDSTGHDEVADRVEDDEVDDLDAYIAERAARSPGFTEELARADQRVWLSDTVRRAREQQQPKA